MEAKNIKQYYFWLPIRSISRNNIVVIHTHTHSYFDCDFTIWHNNQMCVLQTHTHWTCISKIDPIDFPHLFHCKWAIPISQVNSYVEQNNNVKEERLHTKLEFCVEFENRKGLIALPYFHVYNLLLRQKWEHIYLKYWLNRDDIYYKRNSYMSSVHVLTKQKTNCALRSG